MFFSFVNTLDLLKKLKNSTISVFTVKDVARLTGKKENYAYLLSHRLVKRGLISKIEKGKYCLPETNVLCVASSLTFPSYISFYEALNFYNATTQIPRVIDVVCAVSKRKTKYEGYELNFTKFKTKRIFGFSKKSTENKTFFIAEPEKLIIDCLYEQKTNLSDVFNLIKTTEIDKKLFIEFVDRFNSKVIIKRAGYLFELAGKYDLSEELFKKKFSNKYEKISTLMKFKGKKNLKWKLIINEKIK